MLKKNPAITHRILEETDRRYRERVAALAGLGGRAEALFQKPRANSPARLRDLTEDILSDTPRSEFGLCCLKDSHFDPRRPHRLISGVAISSNNRNRNGYAFSAKGMRFALPCPLFFNHERLIGRVMNTWVFGEVVRFQAELANTGSSFADRVWSDIIGRRLDGASVGGVNVSGREVVDGTYASWGVREISVVLCGADDGAVIDRCWEREPGAFLGHAPVKLHWEGPLTAWDSELATRNMYLPRESDEPTEKKESDIAIASSLSTKLRDELNGLKAKF